LTSKQAVKCACPPVPFPSPSLFVDAHNEALLHRTYRVPVHSSLLLLRPQAQHPNLNGNVKYAPRPGRGKMDFAFEVIRLWSFHSHA